MLVHMNYRDRGNCTASPAPACVILINDGKLVIIACAVDNRLKQFLKVQLHGMH